MESWNRPARNVLEYIEHSAEVFPSNLAFRDDKTQVTYAELLRQVKKLGYRIAEKVSGMPRPIVVFMEKSVECLVSFYGCVPAPSECPYRHKNSRWRQSRKKKPDIPQIFP